VKSGFGAGTRWQGNDEPMPGKDIGKREWAEDDGEQHHQHGLLQQRLHALRGGFDLPAQPMARQNRLGVVSARLPDHEIRRDQAARVQLFAFLGGCSMQSRACRGGAGCPAAGWAPKAASEHAGRPGAVDALARTVTVQDIGLKQRPVLVTVEYRIEPRKRDTFLHMLELLSQERWRGGAYGWGVFEDVAEVGRFLETSFLESWLEYLHQHERVTIVDRDLQAEIREFDIDGAPGVTHLLATHPDPRREAPRGRAVSRAHGDPAWG
jgi:hypothetical protein